MEGGSAQGLVGRPSGPRALSVLPSPHSISVDFTHSLPHSFIQHALESAGSPVRGLALQPVKALGWETPRALDEFWDLGHRHPPGWGKAGVEGCMGTGSEPGAAPVESHFSSGPSLQLCPSPTLLG